MTMDDKKLYLLLRVMHNNGNSKVLTRNGMGYLEIATYTNTAIANKLLAYDGSKIELTELGIKTLKELGILYKKRNKEEWIDRDFKSQIPKIEKDFIYLPRPDEINF